MYFVQVDGEKLRLNFEKGIYGPYAKNLRFVLDQIEGYFIKGYADGGDSPKKILSLVQGAVKNSEKILSSNIETQERFKKVANLVQGFETPNGLELLASVHWLINNENAKTDSELIEKMNSWGKRQFTERQILIAKKTLIEKWHYSLVLKT